MQELMDSQSQDAADTTWHAARRPEHAHGEADLLVRARDGDEEAFAELVQRYRAPVYSYLSRCGVDFQDRDDLFQDVFIKVLGAAHRYEPARPLHPWLFTIVANSVRSHFRRRRIRQLVFAEPKTPAELDPRDGAPDSERSASASETVAWLEIEIPRLPLPQREVLILACFEHSPLKEIAQTLGLPLNTVKTHLRRARLSLARKLAGRQASERGERQP